ncbi:hypothetical protein MUK42_11088 [Musa troglodytarum]|uniref:Uncharacterized protein n=1 Tax=Musa troglodytarum TaxID=320322 RepID=A0A9E7GFH2_9LILI|nr:hypothetical protein MUK42_11088 [Musa troglodytarum]
MAHYKPHLFPSFRCTRLSEAAVSRPLLSASARLAHPIAASIWEEEDMDEGTSKPRVCLTEKELLAARKLSRLLQMLLQWQHRRCRRTTYVFPEYLRWGVWRSRSIPDGPPSSAPPPPPPPPPIIVPPQGRASDDAQRKLSSPSMAGSGGKDDAMPSSSAALPAVDQGNGRPESVVNQRREFTSLDDGAHLNRVNIEEHCDQLRARNSVLRQVEEQKLVIAAKVCPAAAIGCSPTRNRHFRRRRQRQRQPPALALIPADPKLAFFPLEVVPVENHQELDGRCATERAPSSQAMLDLNAPPETEQEAEDQVPAAAAGQEERVEHRYEHGGADTAAPRCT